ncbi:iron chelate uptake ABC transporter family permease subunit [Marinobacterium sp. D7]|uniref:FecCD family ABC transporter permease n=1 Tax=Marinobacterium ramblicola TaxID=2849041 RepID=UPI001C2D8C78|nr:iron chelate uptake ABC transporter family permease subunit [Marinobacterium ramblicola]MBV1789628.1 iron chelate uptake ABC transporter family permease subunit [Marinobacterium ramblicola]
MVTSLPARTLLSIAALVAVLVMALVVGLAQSLVLWSSFELQLRDLLPLLGFDTGSDDTLARQLILELRLPRTLVAAMIGANLAVAGVQVQALTRNPLASPTLLGINAGAACMIALSVAGVLGLATLPLPLLALIGGSVSALLVLTLGGYFQAHPNPVRLILAGIAVTALLAGLTRAALILSEDMAYSMLHWLAGSLAQTGWDSWHQLWPFSLAGLALALLLSHAFNLLALGDDTALGLGIRIHWVRRLAAASTVLLCTASVAAAGPIAFVGLIVPHLCRRLFGQNHRLLIPMAALTGAAFLVWADLLSRGVAFPAETPVGVITALLGTPFFILLAARSRT